MINTVINGDAFEVLKTIKPESIDFILTDPPYNISKANNFHTMKIKQHGVMFGEWDVGFDLTGWIKDAVATLKKGGGIVIWTSFLYMSHVVDELERCGMLVKRPLVLVKKNSAPRNLDRLFVSCLEFAVWAVKPKGKWTFRRRDGFKRETGVFNYASQRSKHPTKKPDGLFTEILEILTNEGDVVLDPFAGSGTTAVAALRTGRKYIVIEKDPDFAALCEESIKNETDRLNKLRNK